MFKHDFLIFRSISVQFCFCFCLFSTCYECRWYCHCCCHSTVAATATASSSSSWTVSFSAPAHLLILPFSSIFVFDCPSLCSFALPIVRMATAIAFLLEAFLHEGQIQQSVGCRVSGGRATTLWWILVFVLCVLRMCSIFGWNDSFICIIHISFFLLLPLLLLLLIRRHLTSAKLLWKDENFKSKLGLWMRARDVRAKGSAPFASVTFNHSNHNHPITVVCDAIRAYL